MVILYPVVVVIIVVIAAARAVDAITDIILLIYDFHTMHDSTRHYIKRKTPYYLF